MACSTALGGGDVCGGTGAGGKHGRAGVGPHRAWYGCGQVPMLVAATAMASANVDGWSSSTDS